MSVNSGHKQRLGIYCFYDKYGHAASFIKTFLDDLMDNLDDLVVVVNGQLSDHLRPFTHYIILQNAIFPSSHAVHVSVSQAPNLGSANLPA